MQVYNSLGRTLQPLETQREGEIGIYVCGPTVQSPPHLGHGRYAVAFDVIRAYLEWRGYTVTYISNITDVEDKIIASAAEAGVGVEELAEEMAERFQTAYRALGVRDPDMAPKATDHIPEMLDLIGRLVERGHGYQAGGDVYFSVRSFEGYGKLSGQRPDELAAGARVEPGEHKRDPLDFALWKAAKLGEPSWRSPWGRGRPGWHIECSAMAEKYLGFGFDIHGGGRDLIFPHHENELSQSEAAAGDEPFAHYWLHNGMVNLQGEKMSKSTGKLVELEELLADRPPQAVRLLYLRTHYRSPIDFSETILKDAAAALERLWAFLRRGRPAAGPHEETLDRFRAAMDEDFATPEGLAVVFEAVREGNRRLDVGEDGGPWLAAVDELAGVLGLRPPEVDLTDLLPALAELAAHAGVEPSEVPEETLQALLRARERARDARAWEEADMIRRRLGELGVTVEDTPSGPLWHRR